MHVEYSTLTVIVRDLQCILLSITHCRCSLLSSGDDSSPGDLVPDRHICLGKFVRGRSLSTSNLVSAFQSMDFSQINHMRSFSGTDVLHTDAEEGVASSEERGEQIVGTGEAGDNDERLESVSDESEGLRMISLGTDSTDIPTSIATPPSTLPNKSEEHLSIETPPSILPNKSVELPSIETLPSTLPSKEVGQRRGTLQSELKDVKSVVQQRALLFGGMKKQRSDDHTH